MSFKKLKSKLAILILGLFLSLFDFNGLKPQLVYAQSCEEIQCNDKEKLLECNQEKQHCWEEKISQTQQAQVSLKNTINILNGKISLQTLQIEQTIAEIDQLNQEITELSQRIHGLSLSLDRLSSILIERIQATYKQKQTAPLLALFAQQSFNDFVTELKYLKLAQNQTVYAMQQAETQRLEYDEQKTIKENKQTELEAKENKLKQQQTQLTQQKADQQFLLTQTRNSESRYQEELAKTLAEIQAIQSIIAGNGNENKIRDVNEGEKIASIIAGASACSTGTHLHFEIVKDKSHTNPASLLKNVDVTWYNSPDGPFGFSGNWSWPINNPAIVTQGYGMTSFARTGFYGGGPHTGIDMLSKSQSDLSIVAVKGGELYRGSIACGGGMLRYVKVKHKDSDYSTYYLHVNY